MDIQVSVCGEKVLSVCDGDITVESTDRRALAEARIRLAETIAKLDQYTTAGFNERSFVVGPWVVTRQAA
ncbi:MAG TPA: hypothetical protein VI756_07960 [Blastocatellia bacterium]